MKQDGTKYILFDKDNKIVGITDEWSAKGQTEYTWIEYPYLLCNDYTDKDLFCFY